MKKKYFLACTILQLFFMSSLKGEDSLPSTNLFSISDQLDLKKPITSQNLLEIDEFYEKTLPNILGDQFVVDGVYKTAFFVMPNNFHPFSNDPFVSSLHELCQGSLAQLKVGHYETMAPFLAESIYEKKVGDEIHYHVTLKQGLYWQELPLEKGNFKNLNTSQFQKRPLTSHDFEFFVSTFKNEYVNLPRAVSLRNTYSDLKKIQVISDTSFVVIWNAKEKVPYNIKYLTGQLKPLAKHIYLYFPDGSAIFSKEELKSEFLFAKHFCNHWSQRTIPSCGPWIFKKALDSEITLDRNSDFPNEYAALIEKLSFIYKSSPISAWQAFKTGELTSCFLTQAQISDYENFVKSSFYQKQEQKGMGIDKLEYFSKMYYFIGWNQRNPLFESVEMRKALSHAINQDQIIKHFLKGAASALTGPFMPSSPSYNQTVKPYEYNKEQAIKILEQEGWVLNKSIGFREKIIGNRKMALRFHLAYFQRNEDAEHICDYIATSLKEIGVECLLQGLDYSEFMDRFKNKNYDALYMGWALSPPPENPKPLWHSSKAYEQGSSNITSFKDEKVDRIIDELTYCHDIKKRNALYQEMHSRLHELCPYTFLYVPKQVFLYRKDLKNVLIPSKSELFTQANIEEICPKIFYFSEK